MITDVYEVMVNLYYEKNTNFGNVFINWMLYRGI